MKQKEQENKILQSNNEQSDLFCHGRLVKYKFLHFLVNSYCELNDDNRSGSFTDLWEST